MKKVHLALPKGSSLCGLLVHQNIEEPHMTTDVEEATCKHCIRHYKKNTVWYLNQWGALGKVIETRNTDKGVEIDIAVTKGFLDFVKSSTHTNEPFKTPKEMRQSLGLSPDVCKVDGKPIVMMVMTGTNYCSQNCMDKDNV